MWAIRNRTAVAGIGATEFSQASGRSELRLAVEAISAALDDAGLRAVDVDGMTTFTMENNPEISVAETMGMGDLKFFSRIHYGGGGACAPVQQAAMAIASGVADVVVCYRAMNERSGIRFGSGLLSDVGADNSEYLRHSWLTPHGLRTPASWLAMFAQRYLYAFGATTEAFGRVSVSSRKHAATNPKAQFFGRPITLEDHQSSRWISEPLRLLDCCVETDGGQAIVITSADRAKDLRQKPAFITAAAQGSAARQHSMVSYYRDDMVTSPEAQVVADQLWGMSGLRARDVDVAVLYDHFTPFVLMQLEAFGFCGVGAGKDFVQDGNIEVGGTLPVNPHGGQIGEAYLHGVNGIAEAVRQIRGTAVNQVHDSNTVLVTAASGPPTSGLLLSADD